MTSAESPALCPVCASPSTVFFAKARDLEYYTSSIDYLYRQCTRCHSVFLENPPITELDKIYPANYYSYNPAKQLTSPTERAKSYLDARLFQKILQQLPGEKLTVLDVGGGSAGYSPPCAKFPRASAALTKSTSTNVPAPPPKPPDTHFTACA